MAQFGEILAELRQDRGLTQRDLAKLFFVTPGTISNYEKGRLYLNINGYGAGARKKINVYPATSSNDQVWSITNPNSTAQQEVASNLV